MLEKGIKNGARRAKAALGFGSTSHEPSKASPRQGKQCKVELDFRDVKVTSELLPTGQNSLGTVVRSRPCSDVSNTQVMFTQ